MDKKIMLPKAVDLVINAVLTSNIPGCKQTEAMLRDQAKRLVPEFLRDSIYVEWDQGWCVGATLSVDFRADRDEDGFTVTCEIGWPTSRYDVATAQKVATLHTAVINLAEKIERITNEFAAAKPKK